VPSPQSSFAKQSDGRLFVPVQGTARYVQDRARPVQERLSRLTDPSRPAATSPTGGVAWIPGPTRTPVR
jgi:hypothetical protein